MSANINFNSKSQEYAFYSRKEVPWHNLGQFVKEAETASEALHLAHLDYEVKTGDVYAKFIPDGFKPIKTESGYNIVDVNGNVVGTSVKKGARIQGYKAVYRDDTKDVFDIVSDRYEVVQNFESLDIIYGIIKGPDVVDRDQIVIQTAGALNRGETVFVTAKMPSYMIDVNGVKDVVDKYIVFTTSHNKSSQLTALITDVRVVCNNTLNMALRTPNKVSLKHTKNVRDRFHLFGELLGVSNRYSEEAKAVLEHLAQVKVTAKDVRNFIYDMFVPFDKLEYIEDKGGNIEMVDAEFISTRLKNRVIEVSNFVEKGAGQDIGRGTAFWLYNGVTSYLHNGLKYKSDEQRFSSILGGSNELLIRKAYKTILDYAS